jgi:uncharacterized protein YndB with AHSA1/START domain
MSSTSYSTSFTVENTPAEVFEAVNNVRGWWSATVEGNTDTAGEDFVFEVPGVHYSRIRVAELVPGERVVWQVVDARISFVEDKTEWTGTEIRFELSSKDGGTELRFTHQGLVPAYECYDACSNAWGLYVGGSLRNLITTGTGQPSSNPDEERFASAG